MLTAIANRSCQARADAGAVLRQLGVVCAGMLGLGIGLGILAIGYGFPWWFAPVVSATVFAGSVEFLLIGMFAAGTPLAAIAVTALLINSRHAFYGLTFPLDRFGSRAVKAYSVFALSDEAYALMTPSKSRGMRTSRMLTTQVFFHMSWAMGTLLGSLLGSAFIGDIAGLDFLLTALFLVLAIDAYRENPDPAVLVLAIAAAGIGYVIDMRSMLPIAMALFVGMLPVLRHIRRRHAGHD